MNRKTNRMPTEKELTSNISFRQNDSKVKIRNNIHKYKAIQYSWRVARPNRYETSVLTYTSPQCREMNWSDKHKLDEKMRDVDGRKQYGSKSTHYIRPELWYRLNPKEAALYSRYDNTHLHYMAKRNATYYYMMANWHSITDDMLAAGFESVVYSTMFVELHVEWICPTTNTKQKSIIRDTLTQLRYMPGIWFPTALLSRPLNKTTNGYRKTLANGKHKRALNNQVNLFKADDDIVVNQEDDHIDLFGDYDE